MQSHLHAAKKRASAPSGGCLDGAPTVDIPSSVTELTREFPETLQLCEPDPDATEYTHKPAFLDEDTPTAIKFEDPRDKPRRAAFSDDPNIAERGLTDPLQPTAEDEERFKQFGLTDLRSATVSEKRRLCQMLISHEKAYSRSAYDLGDL